MRVARVVVLGAQQSGRTSLVKALKGGLISPPPPSAAAPFNVSIDSIPLLNGRLEVKLWDFEGTTLFDAAYGLFLTPQTLFVVTVDLSVYAAKYERTLDVRDKNADSVLEEYVQTDIIYWLSYVVSRFANAAVVIAGTKEELVVDKALKENVARDLENRLSRWKLALEDEMDINHLNDIP
ncbi:hypothetical protein P43SY_005116 [Pythium insidiosum]|uniref:Uncharacterized protein n=1 Tax=Pythium insidiosum TaxID=114742 RepID=A0AAD5Q1R3_PYTIN|nr:hypothetical protein P43SY_005116 [Pythium insidiosum]